MNAKLFLPAMLISVCFAGTANAGTPPTAPPAQVSRPWHQVRQTVQIPANSHIAIQVTGKTAPLPGEETLLQNAIYGRLATLLQRRGHTIVSASPEYIVRLTYAVDRRDTPHSPVESDESGSFVWLTGTDTGAGWGVLAAQMAQIAASGDEKAVQPEALATTRYVYALSLEFSDPAGTPVYKGDCAWESTGPDLEREIAPSLQLMLSSLPSTGTVIPRVRKVRENGAATYWAATISNTWLTCPALPHRIFFNRSLAAKEPGAALDAVLDLLQTAEYAVPDGKENYADPLDNANWAKVVLGGQYYLGEDPVPQKILVWLEDSPSGYSVDKFRIVSDLEYEKFTQRLDGWKKALSDKLAVYE